MPALENLAADSPAFVLDSFALLAYFEDEPGAARVREILTLAAEGDALVFLSIINLGEILYIVERERGLTAAQQVLAAIGQLPLLQVSVDKATVLSAAHIKAQYPLAYADAFAAALAWETSATLITGDPEFSALQDFITIEMLP